MKYISVNASKTKGFGTIRPKEKRPKDWGKTVLDASKFRNYCEINPFTDIGLDLIADFNGYTKEWETAKKTFNDTTADVNKRWVSWKLYATHHTERLYHLEPLEGGYRRAAAIQAVFCAEIDAEDGTIGGANLLTVESFNQVGIKTATENDITDDDIIGAAVAVTAGHLTSGFFSKPCQVELGWVSDWNMSVPDFLKASQAVSLNEANNKRTSATKDPLAEIGIFTAKFLSSITDEALMNCPNLVEHVYPGGNKFPAKLN